MEQNSQKHLKTGQMGEDLAVKYLKAENFRILDRNFWKPYGEIDIVAKKNDIIHFVEVKTVTRAVGYVNRGTNDAYEPEDNMHLWKRQRLGRVIRSYLQEGGIGEDSDWQIDVAAVYLDGDGDLLKIDWLEDIILT